MNGQSASIIASADVDPARRTPWSEESAAQRLLAAFALSCLLHAAVFFLPHLGKSARELRFAPSGRQKPPLVVNATLKPIGEHKYSAANVPPKAELVPKPSAEKRPADEAQPTTQSRAEGIDLLPLPAPVYYTTDQLTKRPQPLDVAALDAPEIRPIVASGKIILKLWINEFGRVADIAVEKSELPEAFSRTAVAAFRDLRFQPGERDRRPVGTVMRVEVTYSDGRAL